MSESPSGTTRKRVRDSGKMAEYNRDRATQIANATWDPKARRAARQIAREAANRQRAADRQRVRDQKHDRFARGRSADTTTAAAGLSAELRRQLLAIAPSSPGDHLVHLGGVAAVVRRDQHGARVVAFACSTEAALAKAKPAVAYLVASEHIGGRRIGPFDVSRAA